MAARERGVVLDWDEVKEKRKIECEAFASRPGRTGECVVWRDPVYDTSRMIEFITLF